MAYRELDTDNKRYLRWLEERWDHYQSIDREERRVEEILGMLQGLVEVSAQRIEAPHFPPWDPPW